MSIKGVATNYCCQAQEIFLVNFWFYNSIYCQLNTKMRKHDLRQNRKKMNSIKGNNLIEMNLVYEI